MTRRGDETGFLSRWSRLKREGPDPETPAPAEAEGVRPAPQAPEAEKTDAEILEELGLPDPDSLAPGDDVRGFMAEAVPARLRNRALRKLWLGNPVLANLDELVDYGEDFTDAATVVENLASAWQAGRGYLEEPPSERTAEGRAPTEGGNEAADAGGEAPAEAGDADEEPPRHGTGNAPPDEAEEPSDTAAALPERSAEPSPPLRPRRMAFSFDDGGERG